MSKTDSTKLPQVCPFSGEKYVISELQTESGSITVIGQFDLPILATLDEDEQNLVLALIKAKGDTGEAATSLKMPKKDVTKALEGIAVKLNLVSAKGKRTVKTKKAVRNGHADRESIISKLEQGLITAQEAKKRLKELNS